MTNTETVNHFSWTIGGPQGTGVDSSAILFIRACALAGLYCYGKREYESTIKGGHSYTNVRVSETFVNSHVDPIHLFTAYEKTAPLVHAPAVVPGGALIYDPKVTDPAQLALQPGVTAIAVPYEELLNELAAELNQPLAKVMIMKNTLAVGASLAMVNFDPQYIEEALKGIFTDRKAALVPMNMRAVEKGYEAIAKLGAAASFPYRLEARPNNPERLVMSGTSAVALGKVKAGCKMQTYYPITPASDESVYLESIAADYGMSVVQCEDEIASACMAVGAALTGVRAATSTSCPGFGLMAEGIGWASINEVPVVIVDYQRGTPATGLPTRHEQADLLFTAFISHGTPQRIVVAPGTLTEYFEDAFNAFNYAEQFQMPVLMLTDKCLGNNTMTIHPFDESKLVINRGKLVSDEELERLSQQPDYQGVFKRYAFTEDGVSPRVFVGQEHGIHWNAGDEHSEIGHIWEDPENRIKMMKKRQKKLETALKGIPQDQQYKLYGPENADCTVVTWGSTLGPLLDALPILNSDGLSVNVLQIRLMVPFPVDGVSAILNRAKIKVGFEMNNTGQLAKLVRMETGIAMDHMVLKYTGRPVSETEAVSAVRDVMKQQVKEVVLHYGY